MLTLATHVHPHLRGMGGHWNIHWYELVLFPVAALVVFPDKFLLWLAQRRQRTYGWWQFAVFEMVAIGALVVGDLFLMRNHADLVWWDPIALVAFCTALRVVFTFVL